MYRVVFSKQAGKDREKVKRAGLQHRLVYAVREEEKTVVIARMWTHYE